MIEISEEGLMHSTPFFHNPDLDKLKNKTE